MHRAAAGLAALAFVPGLALAQGLGASQQLTHDIHREMVEARTVHPDGDNTALARAMARRLVEAGFDPKDVRVLEPAPLKGNLVARLRGTGALRPMLLLAHIDVVEARKEDWSDGLDPFRLTERDGWYYGRGTIDDKAMASYFVATMIRLKREGFRPKRDIVLALTADEEGGTHNGVAWLLKDHRDLIDAEFALNEGGGGQERNGKAFVHQVQVSEKMYLSFDFEATHPGGHSSVPGSQNAIYDLAGALDRLSRLRLPLRISLVTRLAFARLAEVEGGEVGAAMTAVAKAEATEADIERLSRIARYNAQMRTTCVATMLEGGHAENALPQRAQAVVNCRLFPGEDPAFVGEELRRVAGPKVTVKPHDSPRKSDPSDPESPVMRKIQEVSEAFWPGVPVIPAMSAGATDGSRLRNADIPTYGVSGIFLPHDENRLHGRDERVGVAAFYRGDAFMERLVRELAN